MTMAYPIRKGVAISAAVTILLASMTGCATGEKWPAAVTPQLRDDASLVRRLASLVRDDLPELARFRECIQRNAARDPKAMEEAADELIAFFNQQWRANDPPVMPSEKSRRIAADVMRHNFQYGVISHQFGKRIDWDYPLDYEWRVTLNRLGFLSHMAAVARHDRNKRITVELQNIVRSWIKDCPLPHRQGERYSSWQKWPTALGVNWRSLDAAMRIRHLQNVYVLLAGSSEVTRNTRLQLIYSIWQHIDYLKDDDWDSGNWLSLVVNAVSTAGIEWTMFRDAPQWRDAAKLRVEINVLRDIYPDGKEIEDSTGYVQFAIRYVIQSYMRLKNAGATFSHEVEDRLRKSIDFSAWVTFPDGQTPMIGDADEGSPYVPLMYWRILERSDVGYIVTAGKEGTMPLESSRGWPDGGWYVMRSPWGTRPFKEDLHMVFKASPGGAHKHLDQLSLTAYAFGRPLLIDPGRLNYRWEGTRDFACTAAHNTVAKDGTNQRGGPAKVAKWQVTSDYDFIDASHGLYEGVLHRRRVLFVKDAFWLVVDSLIGKTEHLYSQRWHFPEGMNVRHQGGHVLARYSQGPGIVLIPLEQEPRGRRFDYNIAYVWDGKTPATGWQWEKSGKNIGFTTILVPSSANEPVKVRDLSTHKKREEVRCSVQIGSRLWRIELSPDDRIECVATTIESLPK